jgi:hypothetical protein
VDFGTAPVYDATFVITDAGVDGTKHIIAYESGNTATGRVSDDAAWDSLILTARAGTGNLTVIARALPGPVVGKRKIYYQAS